MTAQFYDISGYAAMMIVLLAFAFAVIKAINQVDLSYMLCEPTSSTVPPLLPSGKMAPGKASISRFQLLLFTFLVAGLFVVLSLEAGSMVEIPNGVLGLIGISGGSFVVSKGISNQK